MTFQRSEKLTVSLPPEDALWLRREAKREHTTLGGLVLAAVKNYRDRKVIEDAAVSARAALLAFTDAWAQGDPVKARSQAAKYLSQAKKELGLK